MSFAFRSFFILCLIIFTASVSARADYGWMPEYRHFFIRMGADYLRSTDNFTSNGTREDILIEQQSAQLDQFKFWIEPEYGFTQDWAFRLRFNYVSGTISGISPNTNTLFSGNGIGDINMGIKWKLSRKLPSFTLETTVKVPTYSNTSSNQSDFIPGDTGKLVLGDGNVDIGLIGHLGYKIKLVFFDFSPGVLFRFGGYATALTIDGAIGLKLDPAYVYAFTHSIFSLQDYLLYDTSPEVHDAGLTGGSYQFLSGSPQGTNLGIKAGVRFIKNYFFEASFEHSIWGKRYPNYLQAGINLMAMFDFFAPDTRMHIHEIPFESEPEAPDEDSKKESKELVPKTRQQ